MDKHGDQMPEHLHDLAGTCIEAREAFNMTLERIGAEQPIIIRTESKTQESYALDSFGAARRFAGPIKLTTQGEFFMAEAFRKLRPRAD